MVSDPDVSAEQAEGVGGLSSDRVSILDDLPSEVFHGIFTLLQMSMKSAYI